MENSFYIAALIGIYSTPIEGFHYENVLSLLESEKLLDNGL